MAVIAKTNINTQASTHTELESSRESSTEPGTEGTGIMTQVGTIHPSIRALQFLGIDIDTPSNPSSTQAQGVCPFCEGKKFYWNMTNNQWDCKTCAVSGNIITFVRQFHEACKESTKDSDYKELALERGLLFPSTLKSWGVAKSITTGEWIVPGYTVTNKLYQLYRYVNLRDDKSGKWSKKLLPIPGIHEEGKAHGLFGMGSTFNSKCKTVYICEGPWDGMALWEMLGRVKYSAGEGTPLVSTGSKKESLLGTGTDGGGISVIATPGANVWLDIWCKCLEGRDTFLMLDNDHPKKHRVSGKLIQGAGYIGTKRLVGVFYKSDFKVKSLSWLNWAYKPKTITPSVSVSTSTSRYKKKPTAPDSSNGSTTNGNGSNGHSHSEPYYDSELPNGYDVRDFLRYGPTAKGMVSDEESDTRDESATTLSSRLPYLRLLLGRVQPVPIHWITGTKVQSGVGVGTNGTGAVQKPGDISLMPLPCESWEVMLAAWKKAMKWTEGLDRALSVMLASITSTPALGDQLWVKIISPPSTGKSVLCEALAVARDWVVSKSTMRGFFSGYQNDKDGSEDNSFLAKCNGRTLVTKDGDTLLKSPNRELILSQARDIYDRNTRTQYGNMTSRDYENVSLTWILCGTGSLRELDSNDLGARFIDCIIMESIDDDLENAILEQVANRAFANLSINPNSSKSAQIDPKRARAMQLTAGYITYLRTNGFKLMSSVKMDDEYRRECIKLGKFVAYMRARPSTKQDESAEREMAGRLVEQHIRLAVCLAVVLGKTDVDDEVMRRVRQCSLDTARGKTLDIARALFPTREVGLDSRSLALMTNESTLKQKGILRFLRKIGVVDIYHPLYAKRGSATTAVTTKWRLTEPLLDLYEEVMGPYVPPDGDDE